ncbi:unnamed protein product [Arctia plantaginis]|uniref:RNA-directed DNA polymerase n=1 Tax=Arctia plantaginis TaxID=874455 RepID=A0A8S0Z9F3_ARCPL|nr:unnamed protein product [Arctia plantaginis]
MSLSPPLMAHEADAVMPPNFIEFYDSKSKFKRWVQRLEGAFNLYKIKPNKKNSYFLHYIGSELYDTLCDLVSPSQPETRTYEENIASLTNYIDPVPLEIAEYFAFHHRGQQEGETIKEYMAVLRRMAAGCNFGSFLETALRNQLVCGLTSQKIKDRLLETRNLNLQTAFDIAIGMEVSQVESCKTREVNIVQMNMKRRQPVTHNLQAKNSSVHSAPPKPCYRCGGDHSASKCTWINASCNYCHRIGHIKKMCLKLKNSQKVNLVDVEESEQDVVQFVSESEIKYVVNNCLITNTAKDNDSSKFLVSVNFGKVNLYMELDTGSAVSVISKQDYTKKFPELTLIKTNVKLCTYSNHYLHVLGLIKVTASVGTEKCENLNLYVVEGTRLPLLGREWIRAFKWTSFGDCLAPIHSIETGSVSLSLQSLLDKHSKLFRDNGLGEIKGDPVALHLKPDSKPIFYRARPVPFAIKEKVEQEIDTLVKDGVLIKVDYSEYATPVVPVVKANGKIRLCGDYKLTLNQQLIVDEHPLPTSEELFNGLAGGEKYSKIDLKNAYLNWKVRDEDQNLLTLNTHKGLYKCTRLMFGLNCAPAKWQRKIENILAGIPGVHCFIDDIRVTGSSDKEHLGRLDLVLTRLSDYGLKINLEKSEFMRDEIEYCGYKISKRGLHKADQKIKSVVNALTPKSVSELQALLGLVNYYGRFIPNLSDILEPLHELLRKGKEWVWTDNCEKSLNKIKEHMMSDTVLAHYSPDLPLIVATDASPTGVGAVLSHIMPDGTERPVMFASQTLNTTQRKWAQIDKEAYSIVFGVKRFFQFLYGRKFILFTDHKPLVQIFSPSKALPHLSAARMQHYAIFLQGFNYSIRYKTSKANANADALSRLAAFDEERISLEEADIFQMSLMNVLPVTEPDIAQATLEDPTLKRLLVGLKSGKKIAHLERFGIDQSEFSLYKDCILRGSRVLVPERFRQVVLNDLHSAHFGTSKMLALARSYCWWPGIDQDVRNMVKNCAECCLNQNKPSPVAPKHVWEFPSRPFERVHVDFAGQFLGVYFLVLVDAYSKWPEVHIMNKIDTESTLEVLERIFSTFGYPDVLVSDNGSQFVNPKFQEYLKCHNIIHKRSAPYNPATNGQAERYVQIIKNKLRCLRANKNKMQKCLNQILFQYRIMPHTATGKTPSELIFNFCVKSNLSAMCRQSNNDVEKARKLHVGDRVIARNYSGQERWKFGRINRVLGSLHYEIIMDNGLLWRRHIDQLRKIGENVRLVRDNDCISQDWALDNNSEKVLNSPGLSDTVSSEVKDNETEHGPGLTADISHEVSNPQDIPHTITSDAATTTSTSVGNNTHIRDVPNHPGVRRSSRIKKPVVRLDL